jgi:hypothetical protein
MSKPKNRMCVSTRSCNSKPCRLEGLELYLAVKASSHQPVNGRAIAQAVSCRLPTAAARVRSRVVMWDLWWTKWHWGRFSQCTSISAVNSHSTKCPIPIYHPGQVTVGPISGRRTKWTRSSPHPTKLEREK